MEGFTWVDAGAGGLLLLSAVLAYARGFVREVLSIAGWVLAAIVAFIFAADAKPWVEEIPVLGDFLRDSCELSIIVAFSAVFAVALVIVSIFTPLFAGLVQKSALGGFDQGLGFLFGLLRGAILVAVALVIYDRVVPAGQGVAMVENSTTATIFARVKVSIEEQIPNEAPEWIVSRYEELTLACTGGTAPAAPSSSGT